MQKKKTNLILALLAFSLVPLACTLFVGGPKYPAASIPVSTEAVESFDQTLEAAKTEASQTGILTLTITETQITSVLASMLASQPDPFIQDPQVFLRDGQIQVFGKATQANLQANVRIILTAALDSEGQPVITVSSADFGPLPAPAALNDSISSFIDQAFTGSLGPAATGLRLDTINIADGVMTLTGRVK